jgi:hypothetical protein
MSVAPFLKPNPGSGFIGLYPDFAGTVLHFMLIEAASQPFIHRAILYLSTINVTPTLNLKCKI